MINRLSALARRYGARELRRPVLLAGATLTVLASSAAIRLGPLLRDGPRSLVTLQQGGRHTPFPGHRRAHAHGSCVDGTFVADGALSVLSPMAAFTRGAVTPVIGRVAVGGLRPDTPESTAGVRSLALEFRMRGGERWRTAMNSTAFFGVRSPEAFAQQLRAMASAARGDSVAFRSMLRAHPRLAAFLAAQRATLELPGFASTTFHSQHAFWLNDRRGHEWPVRWRLRPMDTVRPLQHAGLGESSLTETFRAQVEAASVEWQLDAVFGDATDDPDDPTAAWATSRLVVRAGRVRILRADSTLRACDAITFDPTLVPDGLRLTSDRVLHARSAAYAVSYWWRGAEQLWRRAGGEP